MYMMEATMKGKAQATVAEELGISVDTVQRELKRAVERGWAEQMRLRMQAALTDSPDIHKAILNTPVDELSKNSRGYKLKLDAANALANGLGAFKSESHSVKETFSLSAIAAEANAAAPAIAPNERPRLAFQPETIDAEVVGATDAE
jgi:DNA-binding transcriptional MocR family regulator